MSTSTTKTGLMKGAGSNFNSVWNVDGFTYHFHGNWSQTLPEWIVSAATLTFNPPALTALTGTYDIETTPLSRIGKSDITLSFKNPGGSTISITGTLDTPIGDNYTITGSGTWSLSVKE